MRVTPWPSSDSRPTLYRDNNYSARSRAIHLGYTSARRLEGEHAKALSAAKKKAAKAAGDENLEATALKLEETAKRLRSLQRQDSTLAVARGMRRRSSIIGAKTGQAVKLVARDSVTSETLRDVLADIRTHNSEGVGAKTAAAAVCAPHARMVCALAAGVAQGSRGLCHVDAGARAGRDRGPRMVRAQADRGRHRAREASLVHAAVSADAMGRGWAQRAHLVAGRDCRVPAGCDSARAGVPSRPPAAPRTIARRTRAGVLLDVSENDSPCSGISDVERRAGCGAECVQWYVER